MTRRIVTISLLAIATLLSAACSDDDTSPGPTPTAGAGALGAWQSASGLDGSSLVADPAFTAITGPGYDLAPASAASPLVNAGHPSQSASNDHSGSARDAQPDIGAYEW